MSEPIYPIDRQSLAERVYTYIKRLILSGQLQGGERIPEESVAKRLGVSRTPIREALKRLEEYGLILIKPRSYAEVAKLQPEEAGQIACIRAQLEKLSVSQLSQNGTEEDFNALQQLAEECDRLIAQRDIASTFEKDSQLHLEIARRSKNPHLFEIIEKFDAKVQLLRLVLHLPFDKLTGYIGQHGQIIELMRQRKGKQAEALIEKHILNQINDYLPKGGS